jgi:DNA-directed RNA polymerase specialized sigma24 family protein
VASALHHESVGVPARGESSAGVLDADIAERDAMWRLILKLPARQRAAVVLRYYEDLDDVRIAAILDCSPVTIRTNVMRALATLRERLGEPSADVTVRSKR